MANFSISIGSQKTKTSVMVSADVCFTRTSCAGVNEAEVHHLKYQNAAWLWVVFCPEKKGAFFLIPTDIFHLLPCARGAANAQRRCLAVQNAFRWPGQCSAAGVESHCRASVVLKASILSVLSLSVDRSRGKRLRWTSQKETERYFEANKNWEFTTGDIECE